MEQIQDTAAKSVNSWFNDMASRGQGTIAMLVVLLLCSHVWHIYTSYAREERLEAKTDTLAAKLDEYQKSDRVQMVDATNDLRDAVRDMAVKIDNLRYANNPQPIVR